jgi:hypothetical protein
VALVLLGLALLVTRIPGAFLIDECNYLVTVTGLRHGSLSVTGTGDLTPSRALLFFDPTARARARLTTPVVSTVPPLYAFFGLPFAPFGWTGLVALNVISFLLCAYLVFVYAARHARLARTPYLALVTFLAGGFLLEYAQGVWPHMLSMVLCMGSLVLADRVRSGGALPLALAAGLLGGLATGVRYQNIVLTAAVGLGLLLWAPQRRLTLASGFALGALGPLAASSLINFARHGWWSPISKGHYYLGFIGNRRQIHPLLEPLWVLYAKVVDFSAHIPMGFMQRYPGSGVYMLHDALKKAWTQSSPWVPTALAAMVASWWPLRWRPADSTVRELRAISLVVGALLALFAVAGFGRTDGFCYNQRYFIDMIPMAAVVLAWAAERVPLRYWPLASGALLGVSLSAGLYLMPATSLVRQRALMNLPLLLALLLFGLWLAGRRGRLGSAFSLLLGAALAWSLVVHVLDDVVASRIIRARKLGTAQQLARVLPDQPSAVISQFPLVVNFCPLMVRRDLVIADATLDHGNTIPRMVEELLAAGRRVFIFADRYFPGRIVQRLQRRRVLRPMVTWRRVTIYEVTPELPGGG